MRTKAENKDYLKIRFEREVEKKSLIINNRNIDIDVLRNRFLILLNEIDLVLEDKDIKASVEFVNSEDPNLYITIILDDQLELYISLYDNSDELENDLYFSVFINDECASICKSNLDKVREKMNSVFDSLKEFIV